jgi:hypothetical protein
MNDTYGHDQFAMGAAGGPGGGVGIAGVQPMTGDEVAGHVGMALGHISQGSILASLRRGLGEPVASATVAQVEGAVPWRGRGILDAEESLPLPLSADEDGQSSSSSVSSGGTTNGRPRSAA